MGHRLTDVLAAERALIVRELDEDELRALVALDGHAIEAHRQVPGRVVPGRVRGGTGAEQVPDLPELILDFFLPFLEGLYLLLDVAPGLLVRVRLADSHAWGEWKGSGPPGPPTPF